MKVSMLSSLSGRRVAFTMAEILLSLTIIGVVAAITLPSLTGNINERTWNTQRKALFSRLSQAIALVDNIRGYGQVTLAGENEWGGKSYEFGDATEAFLSGGLAKVMKLNNVCDASHISDCGMPDTIINMAGSKVQIGGAAMKTLQSFNEGFSGNGCAYFFVNGNNAAFETANGESIMAFYNPICKDFITNWNSLGAVNSTMCLNFLYDLNGKKGPNTVGKDIGFITAFYPGDPVLVAPLPASKNASSGVSFSGAGKACASGHGDDYRLPNKEEMVSIGLNSKFVGTIEGGTDFWTTSFADSAMNKFWFGADANAFYYYSGDEYSMGSSLQLSSKSYSRAVRCVKRF